ncbi:MAG: PAS domain-containing protein [Flavipsychrobacter sp.]
MFKKNANHQDHQQRVAELEDIIDSITDGFFSLDNDWKISHANKAFSLMCGYEHGEFIGKDYWEQFPTAKTQKFFTEYHIAKERKEVRHFEEYSTSLNKWVSVNVYPTPDGLNIFFTDETKQHDMREALANNERNISALINNTDDLIWSVDRDMKLIYANQAFQNSVSAQIKRTLKQGENLLLSEFDEEVKKLWEGYYNRALAGETFSIVQEDITASTETTFNPINSSKDEIVGVSCFSRNISERLKHIHEIEKHNKNLEEISWLYSHKVRKHVATILGLVQLMDVDNYANPTNKEIISGIVSSANELDSVIRLIAKKSTEK